MAKHHETTPEPAQEQPRDEAQELTNHLQRLQAEFDNYRKRVDTESKEAAAKGQEKLIKDLLPIIDSFELALKHHQTHHKDSESDLLKGVELTYSQLSAALENWGVTKIPSQGPIDPRLHEAYLTETSDKPTNTILETLQTGYVRNGVVLRTAKVKVARKA